MKRILYILSIAILVAACVKEQDKNYIGSDAIGFSPVADQTKTTVSIDNDADLQGSGFGVYAFYTGTNNFVSPTASGTSVMLSNEHVSYSSSAWTYGHPQYWPENGRKVTFLAYAPWTLWNTSVSSNAETGIPEITYPASTDLNSQKDLLWGVGEDVYPLKDMTKPEDKTAHFHFRHALCRLHFNIVSFEDLTAISNSFDSNGSWTNSYGGNDPSNGDTRYMTSDASTKVLIESLTITGLFGTGTLSLLNSTTDPQWSNEGGNLTYTINGSNNLPSDIRYYSNDSDLIYYWDDLSGVGSSNKDMLGGKFIYAIPRKADEGTSMPAVTISIKYHVITKYTYTYQVYTSYWWGSGYWSSSYSENRISRDNDGTAKTGISVTAENTFDIQGNHDEAFNMEVKGKYVTLTVEPKPWNLNEDELSFNSGTIVVSEGNRIYWQDATFDLLSANNLYISTKTAICTFKISNPARYLWSATLIPVAGNASAFMFVDADGNEIENPNGAVGSDAVLRIRARKETTTVQNKAVLRIFVKTATGSEIAYPLGYQGTTEYNIIQDAS